MIKRSRSKGEKIYDSRLNGLVEMTYNRLKAKPRETWDDEDKLCARLVEFDERKNKE